MPFRGVSETRDPIAEVAVMIAADLYALPLTSMLHV